MMNDDLPNDWMSNAALLLCTSFATYCTMRIKNGMCSSAPRLPVKFSIDLMCMLATNMISFSAIVIWSALLDLQLPYIVAMDIGVGLAIERWIIKVIGGQHNQPVGKIGKAMVHQHVRLCLVIATITRGFITAATMSIRTYEWTSSPDYWLETVAMPIVYTIGRTIAVDVDTTYFKQATIVSHAVQAQEFAITDEEDEEEEDNTATTGDLL
jgi:hypothetical protein